MSNPVIMPIRTISEANVAGHKHWGTNMRRVKKQRGDAELMFGATGARWQRDGCYPCVITFTRISNGPGLDPEDNLPASIKHVRDGVADAMGLTSDRDPRVKWVYLQQRGKGYEVHVLLERQAL